MATLQRHPPLSALLAVALEQATAALRLSVECHLNGCDSCCQRERELRADLAYFSLALEPSPIPPMLREGIMQAAGEIHRLFDAAEPLARLLHISRRKAHAILLRLDAPRHWQHTPRGWQLDLPESRLKGAHILRLQAGESVQCPSWSRDKRAGLKLLMVLQGQAQDPTGRMFASEGLQDGKWLRPPAPRGALVVQPGADFLVLFSEGLFVKRRPLAPIHLPEQASVIHH